MMMRIVSKGQDILYKSQESIFSAAVIIALTTSFSSVLGLVKVRLINTYFTSDVSGLFFIADQIPSFLLNILVVGAMSSSFLPVFTSYIERKKEEEAWEMTSILITTSLIILSVFCLFIFIFPTQIIHVFPFTKNITSDEISTLAWLLRVMVIPQFFILIGSFFTSILHSYKKFIIPSISLILYNLGVIIFMVLFQGQFGIFSPALGMGLGAFLSLMFQIPFIRKVGFKYRFKIDLKNESVRKVYKLFAPRTLGLVANQINTFLQVSVFASFVSIASVTPFTNANQLQTFPIIFLGVALAQAAFPTLSGFVSTNNMKAFKETLSTTILQLSFLAFPIAIIMIGLRVPLIRLVFGGDKFSWIDTLTAAYTLSFFALSIPIQAILQLLSRSFYSLHDTWTPVKYNILAILVSVVLSSYFIFIKGYGVWSLALAYSIANIIDFVFQLLAMREKLGIEWFDSLVKPILKIGYSCMVLAGVLYASMKYLDAYVIDTTRTVNLMFFVALVSISSMAVYLLVTHLAKVKEISLFWKIVRKFNRNAPLINNVN